jgi:hypothetical protein
LDDKIFTITLDNYFVNDNAIRNLANRFRDKIVFGGQHMHIRCVAHILNLMMQDGMKTIQLALNKIRELMRHIASNDSRLQIFNVILKEFHLPSKKL